MEVEESGQENTPVLFKLKRGLITKWVNCVPVYSKIADGNFIIPKHIFV